MALREALDTLGGQCKEKAIPIGQAKQDLAVLEQTRAEVRDLVRYLTQVIREEENLITAEQL
jgi:hypothetical protein